MSTLLGHKGAIAGLAAVILTGSSVAALAQAPDQSEKPPGSAPLGLGQPPSVELIDAWDIDVSPAGTNLPEGSGSVAEGREIFASTCAVCHGENGVDGPMDRLVGGQGTLDTEKPVKTVGSYWPYATTLFDYVYRAMPFDNPQSLTPDQVYAVSAYVLHMNGIVPDTAVLDKASLPKIAMPNQGSFKQMDTVTLAKTEACMENCRPFEIDMDQTTPARIDEDQVQ